MLSFQKVIVHMEFDQKNWAGIYSRSIFLYLYEMFPNPVEGLWYIRRRSGLFGRAEKLCPTSMIKWCIIKEIRNRAPGARFGKRCYFANRDTGGNIAAACEWAFGASFDWSDERPCQRSRDGFRNRMETSRVPWNYLGDGCVWESGERIFSDEWNHARCHHRQSLLSDKFS